MEKWLKVLKRTVSCEWDKYLFSKRIITSTENLTPTHVGFTIHLQGKEEIRNSEVFSVSFLHETVNMISFILEASMRGREQEELHAFTERESDVKDISDKFRSSNIYTLEIGLQIEKKITVYPSIFHEYNLISLGTRRLLEEN